MVITAFVHKITEFPPAGRTKIIHKKTFLTNKMERAYYHTGQEDTLPSTRLADSHNHIYMA